MLASRGLCTTEFRSDMDRFCSGACAGAALHQDETLRRHAEWTKLSLFDYRVYDTSQCALLQRLKTQEFCSMTDDLSRIKDQG